LHELQSQIFREALSLLESLPLAYGQKGILGASEVMVFGLSKITDL
tara:strand:+ start:66 stop:203 length:138 start_codon:yes stop_codon:yes gene_type:complete